MNGEQKGDKEINVLCQSITELQLTGENCQKTLRLCHVRLCDLKKKNYGLKKKDDGWLLPEAPSQTYLDNLRLCEYKRIQYVHNRVEIIRKEFITLSRAIENAQNATYRRAKVASAVKKLNLKRKAENMIKVDNEHKRRKDRDDKQFEKMKHKQLTRTIIETPDDQLEWEEDDDDMWGDKVV